MDVPRTRGMAPMHPIPTKTLIRIYVLGPLLIEWVGQDGQAIPVPEERLHGRGAYPALTLLKVLLCHPHRYALRTCILEQLWPDADTVHKKEKRLDDIASWLRGLLLPPEGKEKVLLYTRASQSAGNGYRLAEYPLIWVDSEAFTWYVEQALRMERFDDDPLPFWEAAYQLGSRGLFLLDEASLVWTESQRALLVGQYRQCVLRMAHLYRERRQMQEALVRLRTFWFAHQADEDALRPLMELLAEQECFQEAVQYYARLEQRLNQESLVPDPRTQDVAAYVRAKSIQRARKEQNKEMI